MHFPILSVIVLTPIIAGMIILLVPGDRKNVVRYIALAAATVAVRQHFKGLPKGPSQKRIVRTRQPLLCG